ncbi:hypothetical protein LZC95_04445 [Pendulispora brunnea]|uniref:Integral membrane protein n=1 Tax=Pendulispora brunnea TaxID=2905690 RepID=A0ABZ2KBT8_9BACT
MLAPADRPSHEDSKGDPPPEASPAPHSSGSPGTKPAPVVRSTWILRVAAVCGVVAALLGRIIAPGLRGNASENVVVFWDRAAAVSSYAMSCILIATLLMGLFEVSRRPRLGFGVRIATVISVGIVVATVLPAFQRRLPLALAVLMSIATSSLAISAALNSLRSAHTRAVGAVLGFFGVAALVRLFAWELAVVAGDHASANLYGWSRVAATGAVVFEGIAQLIAAAWLGTRTRLLGQIMSSVAVAAAFVVTWGAARGAQPGAEPWQAVLHTSLGEAVGVPPSYGLGAIATFLVAASILFAVVAVLQRRQVVTITSALALALIGRGAYDAPLRALAAAAAAVWMMLAFSDDRAMWRTLLAEREERLRREDGRNANEDEARLGTEEAVEKPGPG